jgi:hypothetical protein
MNATIRWFGSNGGCLILRDGGEREVPAKTLPPSPVSPLDPDGLTHQLANLERHGLGRY